MGGGFLAGRFRCVARPIHQRCSVTEGQHAGTADEAGECRTAAQYTYGYIHDRGKAMITKILICAALLGALLLAETCWPVGAAAAVVAVVAARLWRWPDAPAISFVTTWRFALPASAALAGACLAAAVAGGISANDTVAYIAFGGLGWVATVLMLSGDLTPSTIQAGPPARAVPVAIVAACAWMAIGLVLVPGRQAPAAAQPIASPEQPLCYWHGLATSLGGADAKGRVCGTAAWPAVIAPPEQRGTAR